LLLPLVETIHVLTVALPALHFNGHHFIRVPFPLSVQLASRRFLRSGASYAEHMKVDVWCVYFRRHFR
jgi:hypothetical protein